MTNYEIVMQRLADYKVKCKQRAESNWYQEGEIPPSDEIFDRLRLVLENAHALIGDSFPKGVIMATNEGGLRMEFVKPTKDVRLVIESDDELLSYIYAQNDAWLDTSRITETVTGEELAYWFDLVFVEGTPNETEIQNTKEKVS